jgi:acetyl-CoA carboxylase biotin carboxyl carrier protein
VSEPRERRVASSSEDASDAGIAGLTEEILPALIARLRASRLGELEVRTAGWRVRLRRDARPPRRAAATAEGDVTEADDVDDGGLAARSPAVGYFLPIDDLAAGRLVQAGDPLGSVDVLGIAQDVLAPGGGIVRAVLVEPGQAVEYGQPLVEIDAMESVAEDETDLAPDIDLGSDVDPGLALAPALVRGAEGES